MVKTILEKRYVCIHCKREYTYREEAKECESQPISDDFPKFRTVKDGLRVVYARNFTNIDGKNGYIFMAVSRRDIKNDHSIIYRIQSQAYTEFDPELSLEDQFYDEELIPIDRIEGKQLRKFVSGKKSKGPDSFFGLNLSGLNLSPGVMTISIDEIKRLEKNRDNKCIKFGGLYAPYSANDLINLTEILAKY